jgi:thiamine transport system substrate-binding protein
MFLFTAKGTMAQDNNQANKDILANQNLKRKQKRNSYITSGVIVALILGYLGIQISGTSKITEVKLITHNAFVISPALEKLFTKNTGYHLTVIKSDDAGSLTNKVILTKDAPLADAVFGIDNTFHSRAIKAGAIDGSFTPTDFGDVCFNYDKTWFATHRIAAPISINDLIKPQYADLSVVENPATSSTGLAFLIATVGKYGNSGWQNYWQSLKANHVLVDNDWNKAYYTDFSGSTGKGKYPVVLSYDSSPADEVRANGQSQTANILDGCFRQIEYAGVLKGAKNAPGARALINFFLSSQFQSSFPGSMYMFPVDPHVALPSDWQKYVTIPSKTYGGNLPISAERDSWISTWKNILQ